MNMRKDIKQGDEFLVVSEGGRLFLKSMATLADDLKADLLFAERIEQAWKEYDKGTFKKKSKDDFLKELNAC
jgi:hypothetical protein